MKVPDDGSDGPQHVALKCCVWQYTLFVFQLAVHM